MAHCELREFPVRARCGWQDAFPIDPLTDKPKVNFVIPSASSKARSPAIMDERNVAKASRRIVAMGGQITHKPRNFVNRIDDIWVKLSTMRRHVVYLLQWDDRTKSVAEGKLPWAPTQSTSM